MAQMHDENTRPDSPPVAVGYSRQPPPSRSLRRLVWVAITLLGVVVLLVLLDHGIYRNPTLEYCVLCSAESRITHMSIFGWRCDSDRTITENPISQAIHVCAGGPCAHEWHICLGSPGTLLLKDCVQYAPPKSYVVLLRSARVPAIAAEIRRRCPQEPALLIRLHLALRDADPANIDRVFDELQAGTQPQNAETQANRP